MKFELFPILDFIEELYNKPRSRDRFKEYLFKLQGNTKDNLELPIMGFNPMAKEQGLKKIEELKNLKAEKIISESLNAINSEIANDDPRTIKVVLNLADNLQGAWTNKYTTDFDSKFKINALVTRNFCAPYFWTSENYDSEMIKQRTLAYVFRTLYWLQNSKLEILKDYLQQEIFVNKHCGVIPKSNEEEQFSFIQKFYEENKHKNDYSLIFNFFYGDIASSSLNYPIYGIKGVNGFDYAKKLAL